MFVVVCYSSHRNQYESPGAFWAWLWDVVPGAQSEVGMGADEARQVGRDYNGTSKSQRRVCLSLKVAQRNYAQGSNISGGPLLWKMDWWGVTRGSDKRVCHCCG